MAAGEPTSITVDAIAIVVGKAINQASVGADVVVGTSFAN